MYQQNLKEQLKMCALSKQYMDDSRKHKPAMIKHQDVTAESMNALDGVKYSQQQQSAKKVVKAPQSNMLASPTHL